MKINSLYLPRSPKIKEPKTKSLINTAIFKMKMWREKLTLDNSKPCCDWKCCVSVFSFTLFFFFFLVNDVVDKVIVCHKH